MPPYPGYRLLKKRFVKEVNAECILLEHVKTGARLMKIAADDRNKTFCIAFKTVAETDAGIPHIMEHSVLNGSRNYPVKSPFEVLYKGSLNTFLNAMTFNDFTVYPVASMNTKDYFNLMRVYLDAVFNPLIYKDKRIFMQEGWHYELSSIEDPVIVKGVVYNEMQGAFSGPVRELWYRIQKNLFPESAYGNSSGGYPSAIPSLTYDDFITYHKKYYHPSNSLIILYGNADTAKELECIDGEYLSHYNRQDNEVEIPMHQAFKSEKAVTVYYPVVEGASVTNQSYLSISRVIGNGSDNRMVMCLDLIADVLINQESAPVRLALSEAGVGEDVSAVVDHLQQNIFSIIVKNVNAADRDKFKTIVVDTLKKVCDKGLDKDAIRGSLNRMEFRLREGEDANKGVEHSIRAVTGWMYANDPFISLEYENHLSAIKKSVESNMLEEIIEKELLENTYGLLLTLEPKAGLEKENMTKLQSRLASIKESLSRHELEGMVKATKELVEYQKKEDSEETLATIPLLALNDIDRKSPWYEAVSQEINGTQQLVYHEFTNDIVYLNAWFDLRVLPQEMIQYAVLLSEVLGKLDTEKYSFGQLDTVLNINTGGFDVSPEVFVPEYQDVNTVPLFRISIKTTREKLDAAAGLLIEIVNHSKYENVSRIRDLLIRHKSQLELFVQQNGFNIAMSRFTSYLSIQGMFNELSGGLSYYQFVRDLFQQYDDNPDAAIAKIKDVAGLLFRRKNMKTGITCSESDHQLCSAATETLTDSMNDLPVKVNRWLFHPDPANEGIATASKVQYVIQGYDFRKLGFAWEGKWNVLNHIISSDWLQSRIRVIGGAYGGFSGISRYGTIYFASYRDPNLKETLESYNQTVDYLKGFRADTNAMTRFIIGTIARVDKPLMPEEKGNLAFRRYFEGLSREAVQHDRDAIISATATDVRNMGDMVEQILKQQVWCVYGNEDKLKENEILFKKIIHPDRVIPRRSV